MPVLLTVNIQATVMCIVDRKPVSASREPKQSTAALAADDAVWVHVSSYITPLVGQTAFLCHVATSECKQSSITRSNTLAIAKFRVKETYNYLKCK